MESGLEIRFLLTEPVRQHGVDPDMLIECHDEGGVIAEQFKTAASMIGPW